LFKDNKQKTQYITHINEAENQESHEQLHSQAELDEIAMDGSNLQNDIKNRNNKFVTKYNNLAFNNFRSFMPIPRKENFHDKK